MAKYPLFLELKDRPVVVIGGGNVALQKAKALLETGARLTVIAKKICACLDSLCQQHDIPCEVRAYTTDAIRDAILVIAATNDRAVNEAVFRDCRERRILCNVVDVPDLCDFYVPAIVRRGALQIAIGTDGYSPAFAGQLRRKLETLITEQYGEFINHLRQLRQVVIAQVAEHNRKDVLMKMASDESFQVFTEEGPKAWQDYARAMIANTPST